MKLASFAITVLLAAATGCVNVQPVGPMTRVLGDKPLFVVKKNTKVPGNESDMIMAPAPKPVPPAELVQPEDVKREDPQATAKKLLSELEVDRKTMPTAPRTAEISIYKNGQKVQ